MARMIISGGDVVVWHDGGHALMPGAHVVIEDDRVVDVTRDDPGGAGHVIDASGKLVSPGFVNCHVHAGIDTQVLMTDKGAPGYYNSGMLFASASTATMSNTGPAWTDEERRAAGLYPQVELLKSGVTTFLEIGGAIGDIDLFGELVGESGIRCYAGPGFEDATWVLDADTGAFRYHWNETAGRAGFDRAVAFIEISRWRPRRAIARRDDPGAARQLHRRTAAGRSGGRRISRRSDLGSRCPGRLRVSRTASENRPDADPAHARSRLADPANDPRPLHLRQRPSHDRDASR